LKLYVEFSEELTCPVFEGIPNLEVKARETTLIRIAVREGLLFIVRTIKGI
jgi:hypothetical protein